MEFSVLRDIERSVRLSYSRLEEGEFSFLGSRREAVLSGLPSLLGRIASLKTAAARGSLAMDFALGGPETEADGPWPSLPEGSRHRRALLDPPAEGLRSLSLALVHGSFDPFHLGHLFMGLDAVADGTCDFALFMPNADRNQGGATVKPDKSPYPWRARTVLEGGVDDLFPAVRFCSFGYRGGTVESHLRLLEANRQLLCGIPETTLWIILGSDILYREGFAQWTNGTYGAILERAALEGLRVCFRVVERSGYPVLRDRLEALVFPWVTVSEISLASSSAVRADPVAAVWVYPGELGSLESFLLYGSPRHQI